MVDRKLSPSIKQPHTIPASIFGTVQPLSVQRQLYEERDGLQSKTKAMKQLTNQQQTKQKSCGAKPPLDT
jgi:hypothetical protein